MKTDLSHCSLVDFTAVVSYLQAMYDIKLGHPSWHDSVLSTKLDYVLFIM